ncbi:MAG TPA: DUF3291 domain-containing protein [Ktedonobacteraceae bacterium]|nr:DUF3291 domain-containing protein [Ktedonobacteraceae bacterium]
MHHLAQVNIARALAPLDDPLLADFAAHLNQIYKLAESSPGFIWRLRAEDISPTSPDLPSDEHLFATISVWASLEALKAFVYRNAHVQMMRRRREWFIRLTSPYIALWWMPAGHTPDPAEVKERLDSLRAHGPTPFAFSFTQTFPAPDEATNPATEEVEARHSQGTSAK